MSRVKVRLENLLSMPQSITSRGQNITVGPKGSPQSVTHVTIPEKLVNVLKHLKIKVTLEDEQIDPAEPHPEVGSVVPSPVEPEPVEPELVDPEPVDPELVDPEPDEDPSTKYAKEVEQLMSLRKSVLLMQADDMGLNLIGNKMDLAFRIAEQLTSDKVEQLVKDLSD